MQLKAKKVCFLASLAYGIVDSLYLLISSLNTKVCPVNGVCSSFGPYPALLGLLWFVVCPFLSGKALKIWHVLGLLGIVTFGCCAVSLHHYCIGCFTAYIAAICIILTQY